MISREFMEEYEMNGITVDEINRKIANNISTNDEWINDIEIVRIID